MFYYTNSLYLYSLFGFILESTIYKFKNSKRHSGIFYGPITEVYGFGILFLIIIKKFILDKIKCNKYQKLLITFLLSWISLTIIELIGGNILNILFKIDMWNYTSKQYNIGKYICLELSIIWGILGTLYIYYIKDLLDNLINNIPKKISIALIIINAIDTISILINKIP